MDENTKNLQSGSGEYITEYIVEERDTIPDLEKKLGYSWQEICDINKDVIKNNEALLPGLKLKIPFKKPM